MAKTVLCFGDSNTHGTVPMSSMTDARRFPLEKRWPSVMAHALGSDWHVIAEGHPGRTTVHDDPIEGSHKNARRTLLALLESHRPIDLVVMMLGTNDLKSRFNVGAMEIAQGVENLVKLTRTTQSGPAQSAPQILVVAPPPIRDAGPLMEFFQGGVEKSRHFAETFAAMGERAGVPVFNAGSACTMSDNEGIHMDETAHHALGLAIAGHIQSLSA